MTALVPPRYRPRSGVRRRGPRRRLGQHFLAPAWVARVLAAIAPAPADRFLEIGPGTGALTLPLARTGVPVVAVELDRALAADLARRAPPNLTVYSGDILDVDVISLLGGLEPQQPATAAAGQVREAGRFRVAGNLPYYIASPILFRLIDLQRKHGLFHDATVMVQREVADRLVARPGSKAYGVLTILLSLHARIARLLDLPPSAFSPVPKVASTLVHLTFGPPTVPIRDEALLERVVKTMFSQRRKTIANALKGFSRETPAVLFGAAIDPRRRPETLQLSEIARLAELFASLKDPPML